MDPKSSGSTNAKLGLLTAVVTYAILTVGMFGDVLVSKTQVLSSFSNDIRLQFVPWREFAFQELAGGNLPLWNPYLFSGAPFLGAWQSGLFYPPNWLHLLLPVGAAINWLIALHIFLSGLTMYLWTHRRGLAIPACLMAGGVFMFAAVQFLHVVGGHLANLYLMPWAPLLFLAIDGCFERPSFKYVLLGMSSVAMMILAGHPQYLFYTTIMAGLYCLLCLYRTRQRMLIVAAVAAMFVGAVALTAVQVLESLHAGAESIRSKGVSYEFASMFSFPPENFLTLLAPGFFGDDVHLIYWGRCYLWEVSIFFGVVAFLLAIYGAMAGERKTRRFCLPMVLVAVVLAVGGRTPLLRILYDYVPGFDKFRCSAKFMFQATLFLVMLSAIGMDRLLRADRSARKLAAAALIGAVAIAAGGAVIHFSSDSVPSAPWWQGVLHAVGETHESSWGAQVFDDAKFAHQAGAFAAKGLLIAAGTLALLAAALLATRYHKYFALAAVVLALAEVFVFARLSRTTYDLPASRLVGIRDILRSYPGEYRILNLLNCSESLWMRAYDLWGYDPGVPLRYAEFMAFTQGKHPDNATQYLESAKVHRLYKMLRLRFIFEWDAITENQDYMPRLNLIRDYRVVSGRDRILSAMNDPAFDPARTVILERQPRVSPASQDPAGAARIVDSSTDHLTISADLAGPAILLVTDGWSSGWRAVALSGSSQREYEVLPADYVLMAVPLEAGHHEFRLEYRPRGFVIGAWVSAFTIAGLAGLILWRWRANRGRPSASIEPQIIPSSGPPPS
jgi:hypothetical protein